MLCSSYENCINIGIFECCRRFKWVVQIRNEQYQWPQVILLNYWMSQSSVNKLVVFLINQSAILSWNLSVCIFKVFFRKSVLFSIQIHHFLGYGTQFVINLAGFPLFNLCKNSRIFQGFWRKFQCYFIILNGSYLISSRLYEGRFLSTLGLPPTWRAINAERGQV